MKMFKKLKTSKNIKQKTHCTIAIPFTLKSERLSEKQERELLHDGKAYIDIRFNVKEIYTKDGVESYCV